jgi:DNA polymerase-3 subunit delta'
LVPGVEPTIDHPEAIQRLTRLYWRKRIPNALLFSGIDGIGKDRVAVSFAQTCNCLQLVSPEAETEQQIPQKIEPCGVCRACRKIASNSHPDIIHLNPAGLFIKISQIRELRDYLAFKPNEAQWRFAILQKAQSLNPEAGNALLKILEEPPDQTVFILITSHPMDLLPTIRSRCQHIRFNPVAQKKIETFLINSRQLPAIKAAVVASYAHGSPAKAERYADGQWIDKRDWLIENLGFIPGSAKRQPHVNVLFAMAEELVKDKTLIEDYINIINFWLRDAIICRYHTEDVFNKDRLSDVIGIAEQIKEKALLEMITATKQTMMRMKANANPRLTVENLLLRLASITFHTKPIKDNT